MRHMIRAVLTATCLAVLSPMAHADYTICAFGQMGASVVTHNFQSLRLPSGRETREAVSAGSGSPTRVRAYAPFSAAETLEISFCGPWLDITSSVDVSGAGIRVDRIVEKGVMGRGRVDPGMAARTERPYVTVRFIVQAGAEPGVRSVRLRRPSLTGGDTTTFQIDLQRNIRLHEPQRRPVFLDLANATLDHRFSISGQGLNTWVRGVKGSLPAGPLEQLRIASRRGDSITFSARARQSGGTIRHAQFFADYLELTTGTVVIHPVEDARRGADFLRARDSSAEGAPQPVQAQRPITAEGASGEEGPGSSGGGGAVLPGRPTRNVGATPPPPVRSTAPDLELTFLNVFTSGSDFSLTERSQYDLCPERGIAPKTTFIPALRVRVQNVGDARSAATTVSFNRGGNSNFSGNQVSNVPALAPGEHFDVDIERRVNQVCAALHFAMRSRSGIPATGQCIRCRDDVGPIHWNDRGVSASVQAVAGETNTSNNVRRVP